MPDNEELVRTAQRHGLLSERVMNAMRSVDRAWFVPDGTPPAETYSDRPIQIGSGQTTSQPSLVAAMVDALRLSANATVLEVGTGLGYQSALLSHLAERVVSIELHASLVSQAVSRLGKAGIVNVTVHRANAWEELPDPGPFDGIVVSAAADGVPTPLERALAEGGRMVIPLGPGGNEIVTVYEKRGARLSRVRNLTGARFVPLCYDDRS
ncbi:MAG: protein-L-isoaspartate O-methyltransferase family protein [Spirochaetales bacterium]